jgi:putative flippase GtrA
MKDRELQGTAPSVAVSVPNTASDLARGELRRFVKFIAVGAAGFVVDTGTLSTLVFFTSLSRAFAKGAAFCAAVACTFLMNRLWAYRDSRSKAVLTQVSQFLLVSLVGLAINMVVFSVVDHALLKRTSSALALYAAQAAAVGTALVWNFLANRVITFGDVKLGQ